MTYDFLTHLSALGSATVLSLLALIHVYWAAGGATGATAVVPTKGDGEGTPLFQPGPLATLVVAALLSFAALLVLVRSGFLTLALPDWMISKGVWILAAVFLLRALGDFRYVGFFKRIRHTTFGRWDTRLYSPLCLMLSLAIGYVAQA